MPTSTERGKQQNKTLSDPTDATLALQGVGWMLRKTIGMAAVTLHAKQYTGPPRAPSTSTEDATHIDVEQTLTGGVQGNADRRCLDREAWEHSDWLFGTVRGQSRFVSLSDLNSWVPETYGAYLRGGPGDDDGGEWLEGDAENQGPQDESHVLTLAKNVDEGRGWSATQVWGFQLIGGERRYVRLVVARDRDGKKEVHMKMVYDYVPEEKK